MAEKKYLEAAAQYRTILKTVPVESPHALAALQGLRFACGKVWADKQFVTAAQHQIARAKAAQLDPAARKKLLHAFTEQLARYYYDHRQTAAAIEQYQALIKLASPKQVPGLERMLAGLYETAGQFDNALAILLKHIKDNPDQRRTRTQAARVCFKLGRIDQGLAIARGGKHPADPYSIAEYLARRKTLPQAEAILRKLLPTEPRAKPLLADVCFDQKKFNEAVRLFAECFDDAKEANAFAIAEKLARLHVTRGTAAAQIARREKQLAALKPIDQTKPERRKLLVLISEIKKWAGDHPGALDAYLLRRSLLDKTPKSDWRLSSRARSALRQLFKQEQYDQLKATLDRLAKLGTPEPWMTCARHAVLLKKGDVKQAADLAAQLEKDAGQTESRVYALANEFQNWGQTDIYVRLFRRILELKPDHSVYDANAHCRLATHCMAAKQYTEAKAHCDAVDASLNARSTGLIGQLTFRRMEAMATFRAAGNNPDALIELVTDPRTLRRREGIRLLRQYGTDRQVPKLRAVLDKIPPSTRTTLSETITHILARTVYGRPDWGPINETQLRKKLAATGNVLWLVKDPHRENARWGAVAQKFIARADLKTGYVRRFDDSLEILGYARLSANCIAFTPDVVWVGTDRGLFAFERQGSNWTVYAVDRKHLDVPVTALALSKGELRVSIKLAGKPVTYRFDPIAAKWTREK